MASRMPQKMYRNILPVYPESKISILCASGGALARVYVLNEMTVYKGVKWIVRYNYFW
jgi:hypothetical protein